jgi:2-iminobutanoate/2-iminopropanoate deaminase
MDASSEIRAAEAPAPKGAYSHAIRAGDLVFVSGQGPIDPASGEIAGETIEEQTELTLRNLEAIARAAGGSLADAVKVTAFLASIDDFAGYNAVYERIFSSRPRPARTTVGAALPGIRVEIDAVLHLPPTRPSS